MAEVPGAFARLGMIVNALLTIALAPTTLALPGMGVRSS